MVNYSKVYSNVSSANEIVVDFELKFDSSEDSEISISLFRVGASISEIGFGGKIRVILKPLISEVPIVGGVQVLQFTLNLPRIRQVNIFGF